MPIRSSEVEFEALAGTTYRIAVDAKSGDGQFSLAFERRPGNDDFANAEPLYSALPSYGNAGTRLATKQSGEPNHAGQPGGHSVWFSWTPPVSGPVAVSACAVSGDIDTLLAVYTGSSLAGLTPVAGNDDDASVGCRAGGSEVEFDAVAGMTYWMAVDGKDGSWGRFGLELVGPATNDDFAKPHSLGVGLPTLELSTNRFATKEAGEPDHAGVAGGASLWFKWTAKGSGKVSVNTCGSSFDSLLAVYTGAGLGSLTPVASNDDGSGSCGPRSKLSFDAVANTVYRIAVDGKDGASGTLRMQLDSRRPNDDFGAAEKIPGTLGWYWPGSTTLATHQNGEPIHGGNGGGHSVWFSWTPNKSAAIALDACSSSADPIVAVYTGAAVNSLAPVAGSDAGSGECERGDGIEFSAVAGTTYRIAVDGSGEDEGQFDLHLYSAAPHPRSVLSLSVGGPGAGSVELDAGRDRLRRDLQPRLRSRSRGHPRGEPRRRLRVRRLERGRMHGNRVLSGDAELGHRGRRQLRPAAARRRRRWRRCGAAAGARAEAEAPAKAAAVQARLQEEEGPRQAQVRQEEAQAPQEEKGPPIRLSPAAPGSA